MLQNMKACFDIHQEMNCHCIADLNGLVESGNISDLIRVNEALHENMFCKAAERICSDNAKIIMLSGPSASGKTTSANRLATQLRIHGKKPILMSLDDYYIDRDKIPLGADGILDLEHIDTIDVALFRQNIEKLFLGETIMIPTFNFLTGKREWHNKEFCLNNDSVIIAEGLHALNPVLLPDDLSDGMVYKLYVCPILKLNFNDGHPFPSGLLRLIRRIVRDYETRGSSVQQTMSMWNSVRSGEEKWIVPFRDCADMILNSATLYELAVLKKHIFPLLIEVDPEEECYDQVCELVGMLSYIQEAEVDDEIPPTSLVREFIGGNKF